MSNNKIYIAIGVAVFVGNVIYAQHEDQRISNLEHSITNIDNNVQQIKEIVLEQTPTVIRYTPREFDCLTRNIYYEAGIESHVGKLAVAQVTLNRVSTGKWGKDICKVVYAKDQFSWTRDKKRAWLHNKGKNWEESKLVASQVLSYGIRVKPLKKSLFYHANYIKQPKWADKTKCITTIGRHIFYTTAKGSSIAI